MRYIAESVPNTEMAFAILFRLEVVVQIPRVADYYYQFHFVIFGSLMINSELKNTEGVGGLNQ